MIKYCAWWMFEHWQGSSGTFSANIFSISPLLTHFTPKLILESYDPELIYLVEFKNEEVLFSFQEVIDHYNPTVESLISIVNQDLSTEVENT